jgi:hypothetical protein
MLRYISYWFAMRLAIIPSLRRRSIERSLSFRHGVASVVIRIAFVVRAAVGDALNNDFGIVTAGEGALRMSPIVLGLAFVVVGHQPLVDIAEKLGGLGTTNQRFEGLLSFL